MFIYNVLFQQGKHADKFYLLRSGQVSVQVPALVGSKLELQVLGEGQMLGSSWLIPPYRWNFQTLALDDSDLLEFDGSAILARCEQLLNYPTLIQYLSGPNSMYEASYAILKKTELGYFK